MRLLFYGTILLTISSCAISRAPSLRMLDERAQYQNETDITLKAKTVPERSRAITTDVYVHPHEMPTGDYFISGWIRAILEPPQWKLSRPIPKSVEKKGKKVE